jgi:hypothetical protein
MNQTLGYLLIIIVIVFWGVIYKLYPQFPPTFITRRRIEHFSSPAVAPTQPKCIQRNTDAQLILRLLPPCRDETQASTEDALDRTELALILAKLTCLEADVNNAGTPGYNTLTLPYNTSHDAEPLTNFVGRCLNNGTRSEDLETVIDKYDKRGKTLINAISARATIDAKMIQEHYNSVIGVTMRALTQNCLARHSSLDVPYGPRDPGYMTPHSVEKLASLADFK